MYDALGGIEDAKDLQLLPSLGKTHIPWSRSSVRPSGLRMMLNHMHFCKPQRVIEFGSGVSTLFFAKALSEWGGMLLTVDHDKDWVAYIETKILELGISASNFQCVHAALAGGWYSYSELSEHIGSSAKFSMAFVDGPPATPKYLELDRYAALPFIRPYLDSEFVIFLDDVDRPGEQHITRKWAEEFTLQYRTHPYIGGIAILQPTGDRCYNLF